MNCATGTGETTTVGNRSWLGPAVAAKEKVGEEHRFTLTQLRRQVEVLVWRYRGIDAAWNPEALVGLLVFHLERMQVCAG